MPHENLNEELLWNSNLWWMIKSKWFIDNELATIRLKFKVYLKIHS